jgi:hypothetical protein
MLHSRPVNSVAEPHHFEAAPAPGKSFWCDSGASDFNLSTVYTKPTFSKQAKVYINIRAISSPDFFLFHLVYN